MTSIAIRRPRVSAPGRSLMIQAGGGLVIALAAAGLTALLDRHGLAVGVAAALATGVIAGLLVTRRTQLALAVLMIYLGLLDGYLKLATGVAAVTLVRDVLLFASVVGLLVRAREAHLRAPPLSLWVGGFVVLVLVQIFNPHGGTLVHSLAGVRQHLEFVPLFFLTYSFVRTTRALRGFVVILVVIAAANGVASWVQFNLKPAQLAAWGPGYADRVLGKGLFASAGRTFSDTAGNAHVRPFGLLGDAGSGGIMGALALGGILALASLVGRRRYLLLAVAMAVGAVTAIVTSQGRGVIVCSVVVLLAYGLLVATSRGRVRGLLALALAGIVAALVAQSIVGSAGAGALRYEGLSATNIVRSTQAARPGTTGAILTAVTKYPLGSGLATSGPAAGTSGATELSYTLDAESQFAFSTLETGVAGMLVLVGFTIVLFVLGVRRLRDEPDPEARVLLAALIAPIAGLIALYYPSEVTASTPTGPYLWAVGGIVAYWLVARPAARRAT